MTYNEMWRNLAQLYGEGEAKAIARMVYEDCFGLTLPDIYLGKDTQLSAERQAESEEMLQRLLLGEPVQYVTGHTTFSGRTLTIDEHVLIPRPETAGLCSWIISEHSRQQSADRTITILDIGTGSGCIAVTLAAELPESDVTAWDISEEALQVAASNARSAGVDVSFAQVDVLHIPFDSHVSSLTTRYDIIVSNPPYICYKERAMMEANVLDHEPHLALFVPDDDPLLFYRAIAQYGQTALNPGGWLYFEINPLYAEPLRHMLSGMHYTCIDIKDDQYGKQRMIRARL